MADVLITPGSGIVEFKSAVGGTEIADINIDTNNLNLVVGGSNDIYASGAFRVQGTITAANIGAGVDNSVVILDSDGTFRTDEIDSRVWGSTLADDTDLATKQNTITGAATTIVSSNLTANRAVISNGSGKIDVSPVTSTELSYLDGVTSSIQTQINSKTSCTGTVTSVSAGNGLNFTTITGAGSVVLGTPGSTTLASTNAVTSTSHTHAFAPGGTTAQYIRGDGALATLPTYTVNNGTLTMNVSGTGLSGSASFTANQSGNSTFTVTSNATSANTVSTIVARDSSGNFSAGTITATQVNVDNLRLDGNTLSSTNSNGNVIITPNGTGGIAAGTSPTVTGPYATVGGGYGNTASGFSSTVGGGSYNTASGYGATVAGGSNPLLAGGYNTACGVGSTISGGYGNNASGNSSTISGGGSNTANGCHSTVSGGYCNRASCYSATVGGGYCNTSSSWYSTVSGGCCNTASGDYSIVGGGRNNTASGNCDTVSGGYCNTASGTCSTVGGGRNNTAGGGFSTVAGGRLNCSSNTYATVGGGGSNTASGSRSTVGGGRSNTASGSYSTVAGGWNNAASGTYSSIAGGTANNDGGCTNVHLIGSNITATAPNTTFTENLYVTCALQIDSFDPSNLSSAVCFSDTDVVVGIIRPTGIDVATESVTGNTLRSTLLSQAATLQFRRGTDVDRQGITPAEGEPIWATDTCELWVGDGTTPGGIAAGNQNSVLVRGSCAGSIIPSGGSVLNNSGNYVDSVILAGNNNKNPGPASLMMGCCNTGSVGFSNITIGDLNTNGGQCYSTVIGSYNLTGFSPYQWTNGTHNSNISGYATIINGSGNFAGYLQCHQFIGGGHGNSTCANYTAIINGHGNLANHSGVFILGHGITSSAANTTYVESLDVLGTIDAPNLGAGVDNSVVILDSDGKLRTDEIDSRVWGSTLADDTDLAGKQNTITGAATTITSSNLTANRAVISNGSGKVAVSAVTSTELGYLDGVTSSIQTQLNSKTTCTGTVTSVSAGNGLNFTTITGAGSVTLGTPGSTTLSSTNSVSATSHTHAFNPGGTSAQYIRGDGTLATYDAGGGGGGGVYEYDGTGGIIPASGSNTGGTWSAVGGGCGNTATGSCSTVGGGKLNCSTNNSSTVGGGTSNTASAFYSTVGGGAANIACGSSSVVAGGAINCAAGSNATVGGGSSNFASGTYSTISGGYCNIACSIGSSVSGGWKSFVNARHGSINGGHCNVIQSPTNECCSRGATIGGGVGHNSSGGTVNGTTGDISGTITCCNAGAFSTISGGLRNIAIADYSTISGGTYNHATGCCSVVAGGVLNWASGIHSTVGGGCCNLAIVNCSTVAGGAGNCATVLASTISGGVQNKATSGYAFVGAGYQNTASGPWAAVAAGRGNCATLSYATVGAGYLNCSTGVCSTVSGGYSNKAAGSWTTVAGGHTNHASGNFAFVGGGCANVVTGCLSTIGGGCANCVTSCLSTIGGGATNVVTGAGSVIAGGGYYADYDVAYANCIAGKGAFIGGGGGNTICSTACSSVIVGGRGNQTAGDVSSVLGGAANCACGYGSISIGSSTVANSDYGIAMGFGGRTVLAGEVSIGSWSSGGLGLHQHRMINLTRYSNTATTGSLGIGGSTTSRLTIPACSIMMFDAKVSAYNGTGNGSAWWCYTGAIQRDGSSNTTLVGPLTVSSGVHANFGPHSLAVTADDTNEALDFSFTSANANTIYVTAVVDTSWTGATALN